MNANNLKTSALASLAAFAVSLPTLMIMWSLLNRGQLAPFVCSLFGLIYAGVVFGSTLSSLTRLRGFVTEGIMSIDKIRLYVGRYLVVAQLVGSVLLLASASLANREGDLGFFAPIGCLGTMGAMVIAVSYMPAALQFLLEDPVFEKFDVTNRQRHLRSIEPISKEADVTMPVSEERVRD